MACSGCGKRAPRVVAAGDAGEQRRPYVDPTRATFAAAAKDPAYEVVRGQAALLGSGKKFSTLSAAQDYARKAGGIIRQL